MEDIDQLVESKLIESGFAVGQMNAGVHHDRQVSLRGNEDLDALCELNEARIEESGFLDASFESFQCFEFSIASWSKR